MSIIKPVSCTYQKNAEVSIKFIDMSSKDDPNKTAFHSIDCDCYDCDRYGTDNCKIYAKYKNR